LPAVFSISKAGIEQHLPSYEQKQKAMISPFRFLDINTTGIEQKLRHKRSSPPRPRPKKVAAPDSNLPAFDRINQLLAGSIIEKKGTMLTGDPESQVNGIISYLIENGFLNTENTSQN
jgi:electron transfer flavoprotein beta subunit